jgi:hypothetical protein
MAKMVCSVLSDGTSYDFLNLLLRVFLGYFQ